MAESKIAARINAASRAVFLFEDCIKSAISVRGCAWIGIGTGSTVSIFMDQLKTQVSCDLLKKCWGVPTSFQAQTLILASGMVLASLCQAPEGVLDLALDGADEVDKFGQCIIKGGGGAHFLEKIIALSSKSFIVIVDEDKIGGENSLGHKGVPVAILAEALPLVERKCKENNLKLSLRTGSGKIGPVISDQGHIIADITLEHSQVLTDPNGMAECISSIPGIVGHGLFCNIAHKVIVGTASGSYVMEIGK